MKRKMSLLVALLVAGGLTTLRAQKQDNSYLLGFHTIASSGPALRAERDFVKREGEGKAERWSRIGEGYVAQFDQGGREGMYFYDQKGKWRYSVLTFGEKGLPEDIWRTVRRTYFEYSISWVKEVNGVEGSSYVVHLENESAWKELVVSNGEMTIWKAFDK
jgi:hypothetical protein